MMKLNPFQATEFQKMNSSLIYPKAFEEDCIKIFILGKTQYEKYIETRFMLVSQDVVAYSPQIK